MPAHRLDVLLTRLAQQCVKMVLMTVYVAIAEQANEVERAVVGAYSIDPRPGVAFEETPCLDEVFTRLAPCSTT